MSKSEDVDPASVIRQIALKQGATDVGDAPAFSPASLLGRLPIFGDREADDSKLAELSEKLYRAASDGYYGNSMKVADYFAEKNSNSSLPKKFIPEEQLADQFLKGKADSDTQHTARGLSQLSVNDELIRGTLKDAFEALSNKGDTASVESKWNNHFPGLGTEGKNFVDALAAKFDKFTNIEKTAGVHGNALEEYVPRIFTSRDGTEDPDSPQFRNLVETVRKNGTFDAARNAESGGLKVEKDLRKVLNARTYAHAKSMGEKDFAERLAYQTALSEPVYKALVTKAKDVSTGRALAEIAADQAIDPQLVRMNLGRSGEDGLSRAGSSTVSNAIKNKFANVDPDDEQFWDNLLPGSFVKAVDESYQNADRMKAFARNLSESNPLKGPLSGVVERFNKDGHRLLKNGASLAWPGHWMQQLISGEPSTSLDQYALSSIPNLVRAGSVLQGANLITNQGDVIPYRQLAQELTEKGHTLSNTSGIQDTANLVSTYGDMMHAMLGGENSKRWQKEKMRGIDDKYWDALPDIGSRLGKFGQKHLYVNLRAAGYDPESASESLKAILADRSKDKSAFEKQIHNNAFFLSNFAHGPDVQNYMAMMNKPGELSRQLSTEPDIASLLSNPDNYKRLSSEQESITAPGGGSYISDRIRQKSAMGLSADDLVPSLRQPAKSNFLEVMNKSSGDSMQQIALSANPALKGIFENLSGKQSLYFDRPVANKALEKIANWDSDASAIFHHPMDAVPDEVWQGLNPDVQKYLSGKSNENGTWAIDPYALAVMTSVVPNVRRFVNKSR